MTYKKYIESKKLTKEKIDNLISYEHKGINKVIATDMFRAINKILEQNNLKPISNIYCFCNIEERNKIKSIFFETIKKYTYVTE